ncbi:hypothetical protein LINPERPRIM_LOCUS20918 [Linum perenne]
MDPFANHSMQFQHEESSRMTKEGLLPLSQLIWALVRS